MATAATPPATLDDLLKVKEKAELINGRIVYFMASGETPGDVAFTIAVSLREYARLAGRGKAYADNVGFALPSPLVPSGRLSFSPDAAFLDGPPRPKNMKSVQASPTFAVEVRSENDYGPKPEREMAAKRADYFQAGTAVVWDVDPVAETVTKYTAADQTTGVVFRRGEVADAEPALPGWRLPVDALFA